MKRRLCVSVGNVGLRFANPTYGAGFRQFGGNFWMSTKIRFRFPSVREGNYIQENLVGNFWESYTRRSRRRFFLVIPLRHSGESRNPEDTFPLDPGFRRGDEEDIPAKAGIHPLDFRFRGNDDWGDLQVCRSLGENRKENQRDYRPIEGPPCPCVGVLDNGSEPGLDAHTFPLQPA